LKEGKKKSKIDKPLICFGVLNFFLNAAVSVIVPFYPPLAKEKAHVSVSTIGYIFGLNPIGAFFFSLVIGKKMAHWGRKKCMLIGLVLVK
jgi:MFS family permease